jgi:primary-amine oxidase
VREEDSGILWKHVDYRTGKGVVTRSHRLVISFIATVGNYDYIFLYQFYQDGSIQILLELTGCVSLTLMALKSTPGGYGSPVAKQINAQYHQHFFNARLDMDVDGPLNSVEIHDILPQEISSLNPYGQGIVVNKTLLKTVAQARTNISPLTGRTWLVSNPSSQSYKLIPQANPPLLMKHDSPLSWKAKFLDYSVWVTPYHDEQIYPGGQYLNKSGLPEWVGQELGASVENKDIVLWYNFGLVHIPRTEDWPVMPQE